MDDFSWGSTRPTAHVEKTEVASDDTDAVRISMPDPAHLHSSQDADQSKTVYEK
ncbi:hypothetical protein K7432_017759 [Basidiobolus ranarum]|uniref:Uncharacterized protein n=1 Tax=Basidiobolus ranarum TaxID=34480 RepID=A0ABR2WCY6_9FUNG